MTRHLFGDLRPAWSSKSGDYYRAYLLALALTLPAYVVLGIVMFGAAKSGGGPAAMQSAIFPLLGVFYLYLLIPGGGYEGLGLVHDGLGFGPSITLDDHGSTAIAGIAHYSAAQFPREYHDHLFNGNPVTMAAGLAALVAGSLLTYGLVRPIRRLTAATHEVASGDLSKRVPVAWQLPTA